MAARRRLIAIIENDHAVRKALERLLTAAGHRTESFASAEQFLSAATACNPDCLVMDMDLGDGSGLDLARHPSVMHLLRKVIFVSGSANEVQRQQALKLGCAAFLHKPFSGAEILNAIALTARKSQP
jgi:FixJ family two-component response regulator